MEKKPFISIIIPVYNVEKFLRPCLDSVSTQAFVDWEAICIDDGSTDSSLNILQEYAQKDKRFVIITQKNQGSACARNVGLSYAQGQYIMFLDSDDFWHPQTLSLLVETLKSSAADVVSFQYQKVDPNEKISFPQYSDVPVFKTCLTPLASFIQRKIKVSILVWNKIYKAELAKSVLFQPIHPGEDDIYSFEIFTKTSKIAILENIFTYYVQHKSSVMHQLNNDIVKKNRENIEEYLLQFIYKFCAQQTDLQLQTLCKKYLCERIIFRERILLPLRQNMAQEEIKNEVAHILKLEKNNFFSSEFLNFKSKLIWFLLKHNFYFMARLIAKI